MLNIFKNKPQDKFLLQFSMDCGTGINSGISINLPAATDIGTLHAMSDKMRRVLDRQRAITELPAFKEKLDVITAQLETHKKDLVKYSEEAEKEEEKHGAPKTATSNMLENLKTSVSHLEADIKIGEERVKSIQKRIDNVTDEDIAEINKLAVAA